jgi:hypothetical protein
VRKNPFQRLLFTFDRLPRRHTCLAGGAREEAAARNDIEQQASSQNKIIDQPSLPDIHSH